MPNWSFPLYGRRKVSKLSLINFFSINYVVMLFDDDEIDLEEEISEIHSQKS